MYGDQFIVDLRTRSCSCRRWELTGIPCHHAVSAIGKTGEEAETFVHECYSKRAYERAYEYVIHPINGPDMWQKLNKPTVLPPQQIKLPGRPKKARRKDPDEVLAEKQQNPDSVQKLSRAGNMVYRCRICNVVGHNSRKCPQKKEAGGNMTAESGSRDEEVTTEDGTRNEMHQPTQSSSLPKVKTTYKCSLCKQYGHNRAKCESTIAALFRDPNVATSTSTANMDDSNQDRTS